MTEEMTCALTHHFLVGHDISPDIASQGNACFPNRAHCDQSTRHAALHVGRTATPQSPGNGFAYPWIVRPCARVADWDDVDVSVECQGSSGPRSRKHSGHDRVAGRLFPALDLSTEIGQPGSDDLLAAARLGRELWIVLRLTVCAAGDQRAGQIHER